MYDRIVVNRQDGRGWAVAMGYIDCLTEQSVILVLDKYVIIHHINILSITRYILLLELYHVVTLQYYIVLILIVV